MKGILFNQNMVRAILDGCKIETRRVMKGVPKRNDLKPYEVTYGENRFRYGVISSNSRVWEIKPRYLPGQIVYVREMWCECCLNESARKGHGRFCYKASYSSPVYGCIDKFAPQVCKWRHSIYMPREAARIFLRVTDVRVERLQKITEEQAIAEGAHEVPWTFNVDDVDSKIKSGPMQTAIQNFAGVWDSTLKPADRAIYGWDANPWVFVISFERISKEEAERNDIRNVL